jgi:diguanylate cyclase (GGDEF)-like protein
MRIDRPQARVRAVAGLALAGVILVAGWAASFVAAASWSHSVRNRGDVLFEGSSNDVATAIGVELRRNADLAAASAAIIAQKPDMTNADYTAWLDRLDYETRYPIAGFSYVQQVPAEDVLGFLDRMNGDFSAYTNGAAVPITLAPGQSSYCLIRYFSMTDQLLNDVTALYSQGGPLEGEAFDVGDACTSKNSMASVGDLAAITASGQPMAVPTTFLGLRGYLNILAPVYRGLAPTPAERAGAIIGWAGGLYDARRLLDTALDHRKDIAIGLVHRVGGVDSDFVSVDHLSGPAYRTTTIPVPGDDAWLLRISAPRSAFPTAGRQPVAIVIAGQLLFLALALFIARLSTTRARAFALVGEKSHELRYQAMHDSLTGLPNRALLQDRIEQLLQRAHRSGSVGAALFVGIDGFKTINDSFGHDVGDALLRSVGARLSATMRGSDTVGRIGGDEFLVLCEDSSLGVGPELVAQRILDVLRMPYEIDGLAHPVHVTASIGIAAAMQASAQDLLRDADVALYRAKAAGRDGYVVYDGEMQAAVDQRLHLELDLRAAVENGELFLMYQPTVDLPRLEVTGVEALVRWRHPERGIVPPNDFIPIAEETGLIDGVGAWVLQEACRQAVEWAEAGIHLSMSVNVSARQLRNDAFVEQVREVLAATGVDPSMLILEVTETALMDDPDAVARRLHELKRSGLHIAIDDFGTGYSSLAYLRQFPVDCLKIDQSFVAGIEQSPEADVLLHSLVALGRALGLRTLAEGIEVPLQLDRVCNEMFDAGQGYLFARPMDATGMPGFLAEWAATHKAGAAV